MTSPRQMAEVLAPKVAEALERVDLTFDKGMVDGRFTGSRPYWIAHLPTEIAEDEFFYGTAQRVDGCKTRKAAVAAWEEWKQVLVSREYLMQFTSGDFQSDWLDAVIGGQDGQA